MNALQSFLVALCAATIFSPALASSSRTQQTDAAQVPAAKTTVTPHNHMRDAKGMSIPSKPSQSKDDAQPAQDRNGAAPSPDAKKNAASKKNLRPHSHPQDGKGMYVPDKK